MKVTRRRLQTILGESAFTPSDAGPLRVIVEQGDAAYYELRAAELIAEARLAAAQSARINVPGGDFFVPDDADRLRKELASTYSAKIKMAISLLALARAEREPQIQESKRGPAQETQAQGSE